MAAQIWRGDDGVWEVASVSAPVETVRRRRRRVEGSARLLLVSRPWRRYEGASHEEVALRGDREEKGGFF